MQKPAILYGSSSFLVEKWGLMPLIGAVSEWLKEAVLKTVVPQGTGGSNPPCSEKPIIAKKVLGCYRLKKAGTLGDSKQSTPVRDQGEALLEERPVQDVPGSA